ncbi:hypothetical protein ET475_06215 [Microbacterium protaetiae]|uniref:DUF4192 family protein n=1 Tax=Microbacterium protaetiae TaxID=2509458 RepID=A0A4P6EBP1_9MICO|nr:DUF4192 family protein [Microbacterium protaetiae]QAY59622.1 hypothetical protein ET475_06215 [Microbacterium protaetiae]
MTEIPMPYPLTDEPRIHLADASEADRADAAASLEQLLTGQADAPPHGEAMALMVALTESLLDDDEPITPALAARVAFMAAMPSIPETMAVQIAFGRHVAEEALLKTARLVDRAGRREMTVDDYVWAQHAAGQIPRDTIVRMLHGEVRRKPLADRVGCGIALLRRTAALVPEPYRPSLLCTLAWLMWARGQRPLALLYIDEAAQIEPEHLLAYGLSMIMSSRLPAWVGR